MSNKDNNNKDRFTLGDLFVTFKHYITWDTIIEVLRYILGM